MTNTTTKGNYAEQAVSEELVRQGFSIVALNWKIKIAEIDIVCQKGDKMYFVEVKSRGSDRAGDGFDYITTQKLRHMTRAAEAWVQMYDWEGDYELLAASVVDGNIDIREIA